MTVGCDSCQCLTRLLFPVFHGKPPVSSGTFYLGCCGGTTGSAWTSVSRQTCTITALVRNHKRRHCNFKEIIIIKWLWSILDEFFHHPFLEASTSMKKCKFVMYIILFMHICCSFGYSKISVCSLYSQPLRCPCPPIPALPLGAPAAVPQPLASLLLGYHNNST